MNPLPRITIQKRDGIEKLRDWCLERYNSIGSVNGKRMWKSRITFLSELYRKQFYNQDEADEYNRLRKEYITEKTLDKIADLSKK